MENPERSTYLLIRRGRDKLTDLGGVRITTFESDPYMPDGSDVEKAILEVLEHYPEAERGGVTAFTCVSLDRAEEYYVRSTPGIAFLTIDEIEAAL